MTPVGVPWHRGYSSTVPSEDDNGDAGWAAIIRACRTVYRELASIPIFFSIRPQDSTATLITGKGSVPGPGPVVAQRADARRVLNTVTATTTPVIRDPVPVVGTHFYPGQFVAQFTGGPPVGTTVGASTLAITTEPKRVPG